jgi:hypothetical protein
VLKVPPSHANNAPDVHSVLQHLSIYVQPRFCPVCYRPEWMQLVMGMSTRRYSPATGTAGRARLSVSGNSLLRGSRGTNSGACWCCNQWWWWWQVWNKTVADKGSGMGGVQPEWEGTLGCNSEGLLV